MTNFVRIVIFASLNIDATQFAFKLQNEKPVTRRLFIFINYFFIAVLLPRDKDYKNRRFLDFKKKKKVQRNKSLSAIKKIQSIKFIAMLFQHARHKSLIKQLLISITNDNTIMM